MILNVINNFIVKIEILLRKKVDFYYDNIKIRYYIDRINKKLCIIYSEVLE